MHSRWIYHWDLKLENILLKNGNIKICDLGWCTSENLPEDNKILCGTY